MFKRILSITIAVMLFTTLFAAMPSFATAGTGYTSYFADNFENYTVGQSFYDSTYTSVTNITDKNGNSHMSTGAAIRADVVSVPGYDGKTTTALKLSVANTASAYNNSVRRLWLTGTASALPTTGVFVVENRIYIPTSEETSTPTTWINFANNHAYYFGGFGIPDQKTIYASGYSSGWSKVTFVQDLSTGKNILYINDVMVAYHAADVTRIASYIQLMEQRNVAGGYFYLDDVNWYYNASATLDNTQMTASYPADGATGVSTAANPTVTFGNKVMISNESAAVADGETIPANVSPSNVTIAETQTPANTVSVTDVEVSADGKTLTFNTETDLTPGTEYTVTVSGLKDMYDRSIAIASYSFTTADIPTIEVETPLFTKGGLPGTGAAAVEALENGYIGFEYTVKNVSATKSQDVLLCFVYKKAGEVRSFQFFPATIAANSEVDFTGGVTVENADTSALELYVWDGFEYMTSIIPEVVFDADGLN